MPARATVLRVAHRFNDANLIFGTNIYKSNTSLGEQTTGRYYNALYSAHVSPS